MKRILCFLVGLFMSVANAAELATIGYVHELLEHNYGVYVPMNDTLTDADKDTPANMEYLLYVVDVANQFISGTRTNYAATIYATEDAADIVATKQAYDTLLKEVKEIEHDFPFEMTVTGNSLSFTISAKGDFYIDWGDGVEETITKTDTTNQTYSHSYSSSNYEGYTARLGGRATDYNDDITTAAISFYDNSSISTIQGNLSIIFPTLENGKNPRFYQTFAETSISGAIPANLFIDLTGAPVENMFYRTFYGSNSFRGAIPESLFGTMTGAPAKAMFYETFRGVSQLTGGIPAKLFSSITGAPAENMFYGTFYGLSKLRGEIPTGTFGGISGAPAPGMFNQTFASCSKLSALGSDMFGEMSGEPQANMFYRMFYGDKKLTGYSVKSNGKYLYEIWPNATSAQVGGMYSSCNKLSDYRSIPSAWR
ncbi:MAG: hypothetical protein IKV10_02685 [Alphaproteobacteria bacterium]|nr:hypothetical protein [Alphaproteobacteria bacterium]